MFVDGRGDILRPVLSFNIVVKIVFGQKIIEKKFGYIGFIL